MSLSLLQTRSRGFSLVEVVIAMGIACFALIPLYAILPISFQVIKEANDRSLSHQVLSTLAGGIRAASYDPADSTYSPIGAFSASNAPSLGGVKWSMGGPTVNFPVTLIGDAGQPANDSQSRYVVAGQITPPQTDGKAGMARLSVAWPGTAVFDAGTFTWKNAAGSREISFYFYPKTR